MWNYTYYQFVFPRYEFTCTVIGAQTQTMTIVTAAISLDLADDFFTSLYDPSWDDLDAVSVGQ